MSAAQGGIVRGNLAEIEVWFTREKGRTALWSQQIIVGGWHFLLKTT
jgi:hypothetical protein